MVSGNRSFGIPTPADNSAADRFAAAVTIRQIRYFIAVAETGGITAAASMLGISPSAITEAIAELEGLAGLKLYKRHSRGLTPTLDGRRFLGHCRNILSSVKDASHALAQTDSQVDGEFTLATTITVAGYFLAPLVSRFKAMFPNIELRIVEAKRPDVEEGLIAGRFDIAIMLVSNLTTGSDFLVHTLFHSMRRLWLPARHPLLEKPVVTLRDISVEPYIQLTIDDAEATTERYWQRYNLKPRIVMRTDSVEAIRSFIVFRLGVTILSDLMYRPWSLEGDRVEVREIAADIPTMNTGIVWPRAQELSAPARTFLDFCKLDAERIFRESGSRWPK